MEILKITPKNDVILARLLHLHPKKIDLSLGRVTRLLSKLGNPEQCLPPVIHVSGTNGKGSFVAHLRAILEAAGCKVHVYTSPHLVKFNERICAAGETINDEVLTGLLEECEHKNLGEAITFFEITTVAAILHFSRIYADIVIMETGLGGRLDATNIFKKPLLTAITPISLDHQEFLGGTIEKIAFEKAGILKRGVTCVVGPQKPNVLSLIGAQGIKVGAPLLRYGNEWKISKNLPKSSLPGQHQRVNSAIAAVAASNLKGFYINKQHIRLGLKKVKWPGRLQKLSRGPLVELIPQNWELWLDGGHNQAAGQAISSFVQSAWAKEPLHLIVGMLNSKKSVDFLRPLASNARSIRVINIPGEENCLSTSELANAAHLAGFLLVFEEISISNGLRKIVNSNNEPARILICGSLHLAGRVLDGND